jgi:hypothetical protein
MRSSTSAKRSAAEDHVGSWPGHLDITSRRLLSILERAAEGANDISIAERSLFMACEFWAATKGRTLALHLGASAPETLEIMSTIFTAIGAASVARDLDATTIDLAAATGDVPRERCLNALQNRLLATDDPVDRLLARYAVELFGSTLGGQRRTRVAAHY